jgi:hypothetical protein
MKAMLRARFDQSNPQYLIGDEGFACSGGEFTNRYLETIFSRFLTGQATTS